MAGTFPRGRICWHELLTTDPKAAIAFYKRVVGWGTQAYSKGSPYVMWTAQGKPMGGVMALAADAQRMGSPPAWVMYVAVPDVDESVSDATALGARTYVPPRDIPAIGRFAVLADPQGATFALFSSATSVPGHDAPSKRGEFSWHDLATTDWRAAWSFYERLFGWVKTEAMEVGPIGTYQMFGRAGQTLGGMFTKPREMTGPSQWLCYALVSSADRAATATKQHGGKVLSGPMEVPGGDRIVKCLDAQGAAFAAHSLERPAPRAKRRSAADRARPKRARPKPVRRAKAKARRPPR